jgi:hypothetical protein
MRDPYFLVQPQIPTHTTSLTLLSYYHGASLSMEKGPLFFDDGRVSNLLSLTGRTAIIHLIYMDIYNKYIEG